MSSPILSVKNLSVSLDDRPVLEGISFTIERGTVSVVIGPNGAGKTTLFRALLGLTPYRGDVQWSADVRVGYVPQKFLIDREIPLTVGEFFLLKTRDRDAIYATLRAVGFSHDEHHMHHHILDRQVGMLSGGEFQKIAIAWALVDNPSVLLFDEPTAGIDVGAEETIYTLIRRIKQERGLTVLLISHELNVVYQYADQVICLNKEMVCAGSPRVALDAEVHRKLYGRDVGVYQHKESHGDHA